MVNFFFLSWPRIVGLNMYSMRKKPILFDLNHGKRDSGLTRLRSSTTSSYLLNLVPDLFSSNQ